MASIRESAFLPTVKCSGCGKQVEISMMGDHVCSGSLAALSPPLEAAEAFQSRSSKPPYNQYSRTPPPVERGGVQGTGYMRRGQMTPISQSSQSRHASPADADRGRTLRDAAEYPRSKDASEDVWKASKPANLPGGYGGFGDKTAEALDKQRKGGSLTDRMKNTVPGPFDSPGRPSPARNAYPQRKDVLGYWTTPPDEPIPPQLLKKGGYEGFGAPNRVNSGNQTGLTRSETYPKQLPNRQPPQTHPSPSAPGSRPDHARTTSGSGHVRTKSKGPDTSRRPPPPTGLLPKNTSSYVSSVDLAAEFGVGNPYHASISSASSGNSSFSALSYRTAQTSPTRWHISRSDLDQTGDDARKKSDGTKRSDLRIDAGSARSHRPGPPMADSPDEDDISPRDGRSPRGSPDGQHAPPPFRGDNSTSSRDDGGDMVIKHSRGPLNAKTRMPSPRPQETRERQDSSEHAPSPSRGDCRACGKAIAGKSISSADGRLTGKYHKTCFVCSTCSEPFSSSVFYVLDDKPYCEQDYHKLNNSLCGSCGRGIEGRFAEDEGKFKYHVGCFRCLDCGVSLADGYFDVANRPYCERDAWKRVQAQPNFEQDNHQSGPPRGSTGGARVPLGLPARPSPHAAQNGRPLRPLTNGIPKGGRLGAGADGRLVMNKRMTRLGNTNL